MKKFVTAAALLFLMTCVAQAADFSKIPDTTKNVKKGQWVSYKTMGGGSQKQTITDVTGTGDDREITFTIEMNMNGMSIPAQEQKISIKDSKAAQEKAWKEAPDTKITEDKITVNGKDFNVVIVETAQDGASVKIYMSEEVPVTGIVKMEMSAMPEPLMVLDSFGE